MANLQSCKTRWVDIKDGRIQQVSRHGLGTERIQLTSLYQGIHCWKHATFGLMLQSSTLAGKTWCEPVLKNRNNAVNIDRKNQYIHLYGLFTYGEVATTCIPKQLLDTMRKFRKAKTITTKSFAPWSIANKRRSRCMNSTIPASKQPLTVS